MRGAITCFCLLMLLAPAFLSAGEPTPQPAPGSTAAPPVCPAPQAQQTQVSSFSENWCGASCSPNGAWGECIGYNGCGWLQIGDCRCLNAHWFCVWPC